MARKNWMAELASHYESTRRRFPDDRLIILFDVDGTILDMRYMVLEALYAYDRAHGSRYFRKLKARDITVHENHLDCLLDALQIPVIKHEEILQWYNTSRWTSRHILQSHKPFSGALEVIRWFQMQPDTYVGLNTGLPESLRNDTLRSLNKLGEEYKVAFTDVLMHMNPIGWEQNVEAAKVEGIRHFRQAGYRIFAYFDNEPANLQAVAEIDPDHEILLLHADTLSESKFSGLPARTVSGNDYKLSKLISENALPRHIQFVWHGINDRENLRQFLASGIAWCECDARMDPSKSELILRHDSFPETPQDVPEEWLTLENLLQDLREHGRSVKLDLKTGGVVVDKILEIVAQFGFDDAHLWFNGNIDSLQEQGVRKLAANHPQAILQCPVDFLAPLICSAPEKAKEILEMFIKWGINRFSISWKTNRMRAFFEQMDRWGYEVNIYNVPDLEAFLKAVLLMPCSITSDFNFPSWHYFGRGSGEDGRHYVYE